MANPACSPFAEPRPIQSADKADPTGWLGNAFRFAELESKLIKQREGFDVDYAKRAVNDLRAMAPMNPQDILDYAVKKQWVKVVAKTGEVATKKLDGETAGYAASVMKVAVESMAGQTKILADSFLMKINNGQEATIEGLQLAQNMQSMSKIGEAILDYGQGVGRGVRQFGLAKGINMTQEGLREGATDALGNPGEFADRFKAIAALLQGTPEEVMRGQKELMGLARRVQFLENPHEISKATLGMSIAGNAWNEVFINGLLSSPATFVTNAMGALWVPTRSLLTLGAAQAYAVTGLKGAKVAEQVAAEATASLGAMYSAFNDALQMGWHAARTETSAYQTTRKGISGEMLDAPIKAAGGEGLSPAMYDMVDKIGQYTRLPSRGLLGTDEFARHLSIRGEVAARGIRRAAKQGVDLTDKKKLAEFMQMEAQMAFDLPQAQLWDKYKVNSVYNLNSGLENNGRTIAQASAESVFQEPNALASWANDGMNKIGPLAALIRPFVPFVKTPANIIKQGVWESSGMAAIAKGVQLAGSNPTNAVWAIQRELMADPAESFRIAGQIGLSTALGATLYGMAMDGRISGGGPERWTKGAQGNAAQRAWEAAGNIPYSIDLGGNNRVSFDRFGEPISILMRMYADFGMYSGWMSQTEQDEVQAGMVGIALSGLYQASFLTGVDRLVRGVQDIEYSGARAVQSWWATQTPFGGLLAFVERSVDPFKSAYEGSSFSDVMRVHEDAFGTGMFGQMANRLPGVGSAPQLVDQLTGKPVPIVPGVGKTGLNPLQMAIPVMPRNSPADAVWQAVFDIKGAYTEVKPRDAGEVTQPEQQRFNGYMAESRVGGRTLAQRILAFRRRPDVQRFVDEKGSALSGTKTKIELEFAKLISEHKSIAIQRLLASDKGYQERAMVKASSDVFKRENRIQDAREMDTKLEELYQRARRGY